MNDLTRREFLKLLNGGLTITGLAAITVPVVAYFYPPKLEEMPSEPVLVCPESDLPVNTSKVVAFGRYPAIVVNTSQGVRAYSSVCTHFACLVKWDPDLGQLVCPCHEGYFDVLDGHVISGPPPSPLKSLSVTIVDGNIYVGGEA
jgi:cytochrome b6-f complex iron-sulfur subunit